MTEIWYVGLQFDAHVFSNMVLFCAALRQLSKCISIYGKWDKMNGNENFGLIMPNIFLSFMSAHLDSRRLKAFLPHMEAFYLSYAIQATTKLVINWLDEIVCLGQLTSWGKVISKYCNNCFTFFCHGEALLVHIKPVMKWGSDINCAWVIFFKS